jgi:hypothetical protein
LRPEPIEPPGCPQPPPLGWPTIERMGNHLDIVNHADAIVGTIIELAS